MPQTCNRGSHRNGLFRVAALSLVTTCAATVVSCGGDSSSTAVGTAPAARALANHVHIGAPEALALDARGDLFVSEFSGNRVDEIMLDGTLTVVAGTGMAGFSGDGGPAARAQLNAPGGLIVTAQGQLLIADHHNGRIRVVDTGGVITTFKGSVAAGLNDPIGIALGHDGSLYVADEQNARVVRIEPSGTTMIVAGGTSATLHPGDGHPAIEAALQHPSYVVLDPVGNVLFTDFLDNRIRKIDGKGVITTLAGTGSLGFSGDGGLASAANLNFPTGLALDAHGNLYVSDANNNRVRKIDGLGVITTVAGNGDAAFKGDGGQATVASLSAPAGLVLDGAGNLYIADQGNDRVRRVDTKGVITTVAGGG